MKTYDIILIGTGQATGTILPSLLEMKLSIAVIEPDKVGGTCINWGCTPTKTLVASARAAHVARRGADYGLDIDDVNALTLVGNLAVGVPETPGTAKYDLIDDNIINTADLDKWRLPFEVNVLGSVGLCQEVIPLMREQGGGSIVMINSIIIRNPMPTMVDYAASKGEL